MRTLRGVVCAAFAAACAWSFGAHALEAGAAKTQLVPADGVPLDGDFSRRGRPATGTDDPLFIRALFLQDEDTACFLVVADLFAISPDLRARVLEMAPASVPRENIALVATHTLNGPGGLDRSWFGRQRGGRFMPEHQEAVAAKFAEAMQAAYDGRKRAAAGYAGADAAFAVNRFDPLSEVDSRLTVLRVDDSDGNPIAILANLGVAPQGGRSMSYSADFPGAFCTALEGMTALPSIAFFLNGASADQIAAPTDAGQNFADALAARVKGMANEISCREAGLLFSSATVNAPRHSAEPSYAAEAVLQAIEVDRLALIFMPVIPRGEVGGALRESIAAQGYAHNMIVAPANGYLGAVASAATIGYAGTNGEPVYLGPDAAEWLSVHATGLLSRAEAVASTEAPLPAVALNESNGIARVTLSGDPAAIGAERGRALRALEAPDSDNTLPAEWIYRTAEPMLGHWQLLRPAVSVESLALPIAGEAARGLLHGLSPDTIAMLAGMSKAADIPFAHLWLRQLVPSSDDAVPVGPAGVAFLLDSSDAGVVIGQSIEWPSETSVMVSHAKPKQGRSYVVVGLPWQVGGMAGVNDRGLAAAVTPADHVLHSTVTIPAETMIAEVLINASSLDEAIALLSIAQPEFSGRILLVHDDGETSRTAVIELGVLPSVTLDLGTEVIAANEATPTLREARVRKLLDGAGASVCADAERVLTDRDRRAAAADRVLGTATRAGVVLVPRRHEIRIMAPQDGAPRVFEAIAVRGDES